MRTVLFLVLKEGFLISEGKKEMLTSFVLVSIAL